MNDVFLEIKDVTKRFSSKLAVNQVSLSIPKGSIYGLLGPNGAGKTTLIRMITSIIAPDSGKIVFGGNRLQQSHNEEIGYMPEERGLYKKMKVREQLIYLLQLKGKTRSEARSITDHWLEKLDISDWANKKVIDLSKGMQQKIQFIATVAHKPKLLILDEPFSGLDPINTKLIEKLIRDLRNEGTTIIFSTHRMEQVEELCENIALINNGEVVLENDIISVRRQFQKNIYHLNIIGDSSFLEDSSEVEILENNPNDIIIKITEGQVPAVLRKIADSGVELLKFELHLPRLNEIFIEVVQNSQVHA